VQGRFPRPSRGAEDGRQSVVELREEGGLAATEGGGEGRKVDDEGACGEVRGTGPGAGDGKQYRAFEVLQEGFGGGSRGFGDGGAETGREAAEGGGQRQGEGGDVVEGQDPVV